MCIDPASATAIASTISSAWSSAGTLAQVGTVLSAASSAVAAGSAISQGKAAQKQAEVNAASQERAARDALDAGKEESVRRQRAAAAARSGQAASMAANGLDVTQGDALGLLDETTQYGIEDALTIRENSRRGARDLSQGAANSITEGRMAKANSRWQASGTILSGASRVGSQWREWAPEAFS